MLNGIPMRKYEQIEPYFLLNFVYVIQYIKEVEHLDRIDIEPVILHLLYSISWCNRRLSDYWIQRDKEILVGYLKQIVDVFRTRLPDCYNEFQSYCPIINEF